MRVAVQGQGAVDLRQEHFVAQGGQGAVYAVGDTAFKVYADPSAMIPVGKVADLAAIADPDVIKPQRLIADGQGRPIGYTMRFVRDTVPLCSLFPPVYRQRHGITPETILALIRRIQAGVAQVHRAGCLVVDLNELNFLTGSNHADVYFIDVDSYKTPNYPPTALMESVRDRLSPPNTFTEGTDWFAFAITSFQLFVGIHPYKGKHPTVRDLDGRMRAKLSALNREVSLPAACLPLNVIPPAYLDWYRAVLEGGERVPPPADLVRFVAAAAKAMPAASSDRLTVTEIQALAGTITAHVSVSGAWCALAGGSLFADGREVPARPTFVATAIATTPRMGRPILAALAGDRLRLWDATGRADVAFPAVAHALMATEGRLYVRSGTQILEVVLSEVGDRVVAAGVPVGNVLEHATSLHDGVAVQDLLGSKWLSLFPRSRCCYQVRIGELDGCKVIDARLSRNVLMVLAARGGTYSRMVFRFDDAFAVYDVRIVADVAPSGVNFATLDSGVCACMAENGTLEVFSTRMGSAQSMSLDVPPGIGSGSLVVHGGKLACIAGDRLYRLEMKR